MLSLVEKVERFGSTIGVAILSHHRCREKMASLEGIPQCIVVVAASPHKQMLIVPLLYS
jgi:hypothetical protein